MKAEVFGLLRDLNVDSSVVFDGFDEVSAFADDHASSCVGNEHLDLIKMMIWFKITKHYYHEVISVFRPD